MPRRNRSELVALLEKEAAVSEEEAVTLLESEDPAVRRQVQEVIDSVLARPKYDAVISRHRARFGRAKELV